MGILEKMRLDGKASFVTGGARGIGKAIAQALAEATGASVVSVIGSRAVLFLRNPQNIQYDLP